MMQRLKFLSKGYHTEERVNGKVWIYDTIALQCYLIFNERINLPSELRDASFKEVSLPNKSSFLTINPVAVQDYKDRLYGEGLYLKNKMNNAGCSSISNDGRYQNVLGTFPNGQLAYYAGHAILDQNTVEDPIKDGGNAMMNVNITEVYNDGYADEPRCPVAAKSFVNGEIDHDYTQQRMKKNPFCATCSQKHHFFLFKQTLS